MLITARSRRAAATGDAAFAHRAFGVCDACAHAVPHCIAAGCVKGADCVAACLVVAICVVMRIAAGTSFRRTALRIWTCCLAGWIDIGNARAEGVPQRRAAVEVHEAHGIAAHGIIAPRSEVRLAARSSAFAAAFGLVALAAFGCVDHRDTRRIPLIRAAILINLAHGVTARCITT